MWENAPTAYERVRTEPIGWLTTVSGSGVPSTAPVWFLLEDDTSVLVYSKDPSVRVRNLADNRNITLHLEGDGRGGAIVVMNGVASLDPDAPPFSDHPAFVAKYQSFLDAYGWSPGWFSENYPAPIRVTVTSVRGS